jgi:hypothetical protein
MKECDMSDPINFIRGPAKADLQRSAVSSESLPATFDTATGVLEAQIEQVQDLGAQFVFWGRLISTDLHGAFFTGTCDANTGQGHLALKKAA